MKHASKLAVTLVLGAVVAGCDIGEGSTIETLEIVPAATATQLESYDLGESYKLFECLRDELLVRATFTDGTIVNFSNRVDWSSSDDSVVQVSNGDIPAVLASGNPAKDGSFWVHPDLKYGRGTVIPVGAAGGEATITARFANLSASIDVSIHTPSFRLIAVPEDDPASAEPPYYIGQNTVQRVAVLGEFEGRTVPAPDFAGGVANAININPFRFVLSGGAFVPQDDEVDGDVDLWVIDEDDGSGNLDRIVEMRATTTDAFVDGVKANFTPYKLIAETSLCPGTGDADSPLRPVAAVQIASFIADDPGTDEDDRLVLTREAGFNGSGFLAGDQVIGTNQAMNLRGKLDAKGDGTLIVDQYLNTLAAYVVQPLDQSCEDADALLGCRTNATFSVSAGLLATTSGALEGGTGRLQACFPVCVTPAASLEVDDPAPDTGVPVSFTATAINPPADVAVVQYLFDFGDGTTLGPQASPLASHAYGTAGQYTATVRLVDAAFPAEFLSQNAGAVRVLAGVDPVAGNTAPTAVMTVSLTRTESPVVVTFGGVTSTDPNADDSITVYEFDPGDGTPIVRQTSPTLVHTYLDATGAPFTPTLRVYDESGLASAVVNGTEVEASGGVTTVMRSNVLDARARAATLCMAEILPPLASAPSAPAFSFPGLRFQMLGSFVADTDTDTCTDPVIGTQLVTRYAQWAVRPEGVTDGISDIADLRENTGEYQFPGQAIYFNDVAEDTILEVQAVMGGPFSSLDIDPVSSRMTVTPCTSCP